MHDSDTRASVYRFTQIDSKKNPKKKYIDYEKGDLTTILDFQILGEAAADQTTGGPDGDDILSISKATFTKLEKLFKNAGKWFPRVNIYLILWCTR